MSIHQQMISPSKSPLLVGQNQPILSQNSNSRANYASRAVTLKSSVVQPKAKSSLSKMVKLTGASQKSWTVPLKLDLSMVQAQVNQDIEGISMI